MGDNIDDFFVFLIARKKVHGTFRKLNKRSEMKTTGVIEVITR